MWVKGKRPLWCYIGMDFDHGKYSFSKPQRTFNYPSETFQNLLNAYEVKFPSRLEKLKSLIEMFVNLLKTDQVKYPFVFLKLKPIMDMYECLLKILKGGVPSE